MTARTSLLFLAAAACSGADPAPVDTAGSSSTGFTSSMSCEEGFYDGPVQVDTTGVSCGGGMLLFLGDTVGWAAGGFLFVQQTDGDPSAQWSEEHDVEDTLFDACGGWCVIEQQLVPVAGPEGWERNERTAFDCADGSGRSYAVGVFDLDGAYVDCVAWGHDPQGLVDGTAGARANQPSHDLSSCTILPRQ